MVFNRESNVIEEGVSEYQNSCCVIPSMVLAEEAALREGASKIKELRGSGEIFLLGVLVCFMTCFAHLKKKEYWIPQMVCTCSPCITFSCLASTTS